MPAGWPQSLQYPEVIQAGVTHQYFACALYFLTRHEDELFQRTIQRCGE